MPDFVPHLALIGLVVSVINFVKYLRAGDINGAATLFAVWVAGVIGVMVAAQTDFAEGFLFGDTNLGTANAWTQLFIGLTLGSTGALLNEFKQAIDNGDSARKPPLIASGPKRPDGAKVD